MNPISFVYTGYYYLYADSGLSRKPNFSARGSRTLTAMFYVFALLLVVGNFYDGRFGEGSFPFGAIAILCGLAIAWLSDRENTTHLVWRTPYRIVGSQADAGKSCFIRVDAGQLALFCCVWFGDSPKVVTATRTGGSVVVTHGDG